MKKYIPSEIEPKWQKKWTESNLYSSNLEKPDKYYVLAEFAYPSGDLHMGHWFTFGGADIFARMKRMQGLNVFFPNGYDAFGLPAENAAIKRNINPRDWTMANIETMRKQFDSMGGSFSFDHQVITCDPAYYKWNQWIFLRMLEKGVAYRGKSFAKWCPSCQTVLADEQVVVGECERCGTEVEEKEIDQWFLKITDYAERLLWSEEVEDPERSRRVDWPKAVQEGQNNWIGRSEGIVINFDEIKAFTTRPDTLFGATFIVISPEHSLLSRLVTPENKTKVEDYIKEAGKKTELERKESKEKTGVFTGSYVVNPINKEKIPVWVADYVLMGYGTGAIMGVPAHDQRDFEFAQKFNLPIKTVIEPVMGQGRENEEFRSSIVAIVYNPKLKKYLSINWGKELGGNLFVGGGMDGDQDPIETAKREIKEETGYMNVKLISTTEKIHHHYRAYSKGINREIEAIGLYFELVDEEKTEPTPEKDESGKFSVEWLTKDEAESRVIEKLHRYVFEKLISGRVYTDEGVLVDSEAFTGLSSSEAKEKISDYIEKNQLGQRKIQYHLHDWSISRQRYWGTPIPVIHCPQCGVVSVPEKDLPVELPQDVEFKPTGQSPLIGASDWVNVSCPKCSGPAKRETDTMDGFFDSSWYFFRYLDPKNESQIFDKSIVKKWLPLEIYFGGAEHTLGHTLYSRFFTKFFKDLGLISFEEYAQRRVNHGIVLGPDGEKMSKSRGNVVNPDDEVKRYGADTIRIHMAFFMPYSGTGPWVSDRVSGSYRFLQRVWELQEKVAIKGSTLRAEDLKIMHKTIKKVTEDIENIKLNTAVASLMEWLNYLSKKEKVEKEGYKIFLLLLAPFAPHITEELWSILGGKHSIHQQSWPKFDNKYLEEEELTIVVQVNGKIRETLLIQKDIKKDREEVENLAKNSEKIKKFLNGKPVKKSVYIEGKIINFVV